MLSRAELSPGTEPTSQGAFEKKHAGRPWRLSRGSRHCEAQAVAAVRVQSLAWNFHLPLVQPKEKKKGRKIKTAEEEDVAPPSPTNTPRKKKKKKNKKAKTQLTTIEITAKLQTRVFFFFF